MPPAVAPETAAGETRRACPRGAGDTMLKRIERIGGEFLYLIHWLGRMGLFLVAALWHVVTPPYQISPVIKQLHFIGARSMFVIIFTGTFTGMVSALQAYHALKQVGSEGLVGAFVAVGVIRELGPVLAALMVIGRAGSAICAEIGIMRNSEQIDALECMAIEPLKYLMAPKFVAAIISLPLLTFVFDVTAIFGGWLVGVGMLGINEGIFFERMVSAVGWSDLRMGTIKPLIFAVLIVWITAAKGYYLHMDRGGGFGAEGVSRATTSAVVLASVTILVSDYIISAFML